MVQERLEMPLIEFKGNCPRNVSADSKYSIRNVDGTYAVTLQYNTDDEMWNLNNKEHSDLVEKVNNIKTQAGNPLGGTFYINEYKQVIVPSASNSKYYVAGHYRLPIVFEFEGNYIGGENLPEDLTPGDKWKGPMTGIPYILSPLNAHGNALGEIYYDYEPRKNVKKRVKLVRQIGADRANRTMKKIRSIKGPQGGRFYVNEHGHLFCPKIDESAFGNYTEHLFIGELNTSDWFPDPHSN